MDNWLTLRLIAERLNDQYHFLNTKIVQGKGHRPIWNVTDIRDPQTERVMETIADDLQTLRLMVEQLRQCAADSYAITLTPQSISET